MTGAEILAGVRVTDYGDAGLLLLADDEYSDRLWRRLQAIAARIEGARLPGVIEVIPSYDSILLLLDYTITDPATARRGLQGLEQYMPSSENRPVSRTFRVPIAFSGEFGPDLEAAALEAGLSVHALITAVTESSFTVRCLAGPLAQPLLDAPPLPGEVRRLAIPRTVVPTGSLAVAGRQSTVYTTRSPGGWALIGRTPVQFFDPRARPPVPYRRGDRFKFFPISESVWQHYHGSFVAQHADGRRED
jgi:KipI family sensor histidine kinase inhibitor